jgi:hypothetical protein
MSGLNSSHPVTSNRELVVHMQFVSTLHCSTSTRCQLKKKFLTIAQSLYQVWEIPRSDKDLVGVDTVATGTVYHPAWKISK